MPETFEPRRPRGPRDPGDAWVEGAAGRFWGRFGAAGLLAHDPRRGILLQHRVEWSDQGGTWGLPGGARHENEDAVVGALREANEEAGVPGEPLHVRFMHVLDHGYWSYTTVAAEVLEPFEAVISDPESVELRWVPLSGVESYPLHSGFADAWPALCRQLARPVIIVLDAANIVGSRPDGWWRDRAGAAERLLGRMDTLARTGTPGSVFGLVEFSHVWPSFTVVLEGQARAARWGGEGRVNNPVSDPAEATSGAGAAFGAGDAFRDPLTRVISAKGSGDEAIVAATAELAETASVMVVTADHGLRARVEALGASTVGPSWFWELVDRTS